MSSAPTESPLPGTPAPTATTTAVPEPVEYTGVTSEQFSDFATAVVFAFVLVIALLGYLALSRR